MDPFFQKKYKIGHNYLADVHRTYNHKIPNETFDRALKFREDEQRRIDALVAENESLRRTAAQREISDMRFSKILDETRTRLSKVRVKYGSSADRGDDSSGSGQLPPTQTSTSEGNGDRDRELPGQVLPTHSAPDSRGQGSEHTDEGRPPATDGDRTEPIGGDVREE